MERSSVGVGETYFWVLAPSQSAQPLKFTTSDSCDRIKDEFQFLQAQYHSLQTNLRMSAIDSFMCRDLSGRSRLKIREDIPRGNKVVGSGTLSLGNYTRRNGIGNETERKREFLPVTDPGKAALDLPAALSEVKRQDQTVSWLRLGRFYGLWVLLAPKRLSTSHIRHQAAEIVKRLNGICAQVIPFLSQEHQQQVVQAIERAKQVTAPELNTVIRQQLQAQQLSHLHGLTVPLTPLPAGLQPPVIPSVSASAGLLALSSALGSQIHLTTKDDKNHHDGDHQRDEGVQKPD
eukprot:gi/632962156/ref/XP_007897153.1/ PREDICTED: amino-terminal enhancer of split-like [Callorhinchus milii]